MYRVQADCTFTCPQADQDTDVLFDRFLDAVYDRLLDLAERDTDFTDPDLTAALVPRWAGILAMVRAAGPDEAVRRFSAHLDTALDAIGAAVGLPAFRLDAQALEVRAAAAA